MLKKVKRVKLYEDIAFQIEEAIIAGDFTAGDKLPTERKLEEILGASRGTIRQSLRILEQKGVLEIKTGAQGGAFVREITAELISKSIGLLIRFNYVLPDHIAKFREGIEGILIARLAAENAEPSDVQELKEMLDGLIEISSRKDMDWPAFDALEGKMHVMIGRMTKNPLYEALTVTIMQSVRNFHQVIKRNKKTMTEVISDWEGIIRSLEKNDAEVARRLIRDHIYKWNDAYKAGFNK